MIRATHPIPDRLAEERLLKSRVEFGAATGRKDGTAAEAG